MSKIWKTLTILMLSLVLLATACNGQSDFSSGTPSGGGSVQDEYQDYNPDKQPGGDQFDYSGNYATPELKIDGLGDDEQWKQITSPLAVFGHDNAASVKAYRGTDALFFLFEVSDTILLTEGNTNDDAVTRSDSIEFYLDTLANGGTKPQNDDYQINLGIHGKTRIMQGSGSGWGNWNGLIDYEVSINGTLNDSNDANDVGYTVEVMIPYSQINIEKTDTIAVSFGQVDKVNNAGAQATVHWDWFGWTYEGFLREPQTPNNYVLLDKDNNLMDRDSEVRPNADIAGYVLDSTTAQPVEGATVVIAGYEFNQTVTTDSQGFFSVAQVSPESDYTVTVTKEGYLGNSVVYTRGELRGSNGGRVLKDIEIKNEEAVDKTVIKGTVKNLIDGAIGGATVAIEGTLMTTTADSNGQFSIEGVPVEEGKDVTLVVTANNYAESKTYVKNSTLVVGGETVLGDVNIHLPYATASGSNGFGLKSDAFADSSVKIGRALGGIEFLFEGTRKLAGNIELYLDVKESTSQHRDNEESLWLFGLSDSGSIHGNHYAGGNFVATGLEYTLFYNTENGYASRFFVPYDYLGITPLEVFGISLGQWCTAVSDWDGWGYQGQFIAPEFTNNYVRVSATNGFYRAENNISMVTLSGNVGIAGVLVSAGDTSNTTGNSGSYSFRVPASSEALTITYTALGYQTKQTVIPANYFDTHYSYWDEVTMEKQYATISGVITDSQTLAPISGVTVALDENTSATTDANGAYSIGNIWTKNSVKLTVSHPDYATQTIDIEATALAENTTYKADVALVSTTQIKYVTANGQINNVGGPVSGASVKLNNVQVAVTNNQGKFTIENFKGVDCELTIEKEGYMSQKIVFKANELQADQESFTFATVDMPKEYNSLGILEEKPGKEEHFARFSGAVTRTATALQFKFTAARAFTNGQLEVYLDTGTVAANKGSVEVQINLCADKSVNVVRGLAANSYTVVYGGEDGNREILLTIPYQSLGMGATDIIGFYMGQWSTSASDWDPLTFNGAGLNADIMSDYLRISGSTTVYRYATNEQIVTVQGNAGMAGVTVRIGANTTTSDASGNFSLLIAKPEGAAEINYYKAGYTSLVKEIPANAFDTTDVFEDEVTLSEHLVNIQGLVTDSVSGDALAGVTVSIKNNATATNTTKANGSYAFSELASGNAITLVFATENYATQEYTLTVETLAGATDHTVNIQLISTLVIRNIDMFGVVSNVNGVVAGAQVSVNGLDVTATTNANGEFTLTGVNTVDHVITVTKAGYIASELTVLAKDIAQDANDYNLGNIDIKLDYGEMPGLIADKSDKFASWKGYVTRSNVGFEFKFVGKTAFSGRIELFVDTKTSAGDNARDLTDYLFNLNADGSFTIVNWGEGTKNETKHKDMVLTVKNATSIPEVYFTLPYAFFGQVNTENAVAATEVIGISVGQWSNSANDWDGWDCFQHIGTSQSVFVKPEMPSDYIRISKDNILYAKADNVEVVDLSSYYFRFGTGTFTTFAGGSEAGIAGSAGVNADYIRGKIAKRDENGVTFEFITTGDFSTNKDTGEIEMILIYFDTGSVSAGGWNPDYLIKIASDGTVYGNNSAWWSASNANKLNSVATVTKENGVTKVVYTLSYDTIGITATEVFGVAMREASHNAGDHTLYDPWYDFYYKNETEGRDAADCARFIRVAADGSVYDAANNNG